jgi:alpha-amylase/alpha-mannosidase (GH57 family)
MPRIYLCFLWHMHQPFYKDLASGEYKLPWTRLHALKDYYGMVEILREFPNVRQTFNLVPSMMAQVDEYARGDAHDPYLVAALKPAETLTEADQTFLLQQFLQPHPPSMIQALPRYAGLSEARHSQDSLETARRRFSVQDFRDLQVISQLIWFDEEFRTADPAIRDLFAKGADYTLDDQRLVGRKQLEILGKVIPIYREMAGAGQIEVSTTPYYHPILPLLCDSNIASVSHPGVPLPPPFRYPEDAHTQLEMARKYVEREFGVAPVGLWPSEGSVSDEVFGIAAEVGFHWAASDSGVLGRTLGRAIGVDAIYRPYRWEQNRRQIGVLFRDHFLSDLIGFVYSGMDSAQAAHDFLHRIRENCRGILAGGRDALVPIILDGENAWEYYDHNGRPFLRYLYMAHFPRRADVRRNRQRGVAKWNPSRSRTSFPGSWINANFDVWIGAEEDNQAWSQLLRAREAYQAAANVPEDRRRLAYEELLIAEGSDWCWWYGPEHDSANRVEFDQLYRSHLANVYRFLNLSPPEELSRPDSARGRERRARPAQRTDSAGHRRRSHFVFRMAGRRLVSRGRALRLHARQEVSGARSVLRQRRRQPVSAGGLSPRLGTDHFGNGSAPEYLGGRPGAIQPGDRALRLRPRQRHGAEAGRRAGTGRGRPWSSRSRTCWRRAFRWRAGRERRRSRSVFSSRCGRAALPMDAVPQQGWIEMTPADKTDWAV